jgi:hypothetical protein
LPPGGAEVERHPRPIVDAAAIAIKRADICE